MIKTAGYELLTVCDRAWKELKVKTLPEEAREGDSLDDRKYFTLARVLIHELYVMPVQPNVDYRNF